MSEGSPVAAVLAALHFAAGRHRDQRRKGLDAAPFINHPIEVAELLARVAGVTDPVTLQAAVLHDVLEDTATDPAELEARFGPEVRRVVQEVTDDRRLPKEERKRLQVETAACLSRSAQLIKVADKISNARAVAQEPPAGWSLQRRREYLCWCQRVVSGCRGCSPPLEALFDRAVAESHRALDALDDPPA